MWSAGGACRSRNPSAHLSSSPVNTTSRSTVLRLLACGAVLVVGASLGAGCSGDDDSAPKTAQESLDALNLSDTPAQVLANAVERLDPAAVIGEELGRTYLQVKYALQGYAWAEAACAVDATVGIVTPEVFASTPVVRLDSLPYDFPPVEAATRGCASPESVARIDSPRDPSAAPGTPNASAAPDIDGASVGTMLEAFYRISADTIGLTDTETDCIVDAVLGGRSTAEFVDLAVGRDRIDVGETEDDVVGCLKGDRIDVVTPVAAKDLLARQTTAKAEQARIEGLINAQSQAAAQSSTTIATVGG